MHESGVTLLSLVQSTSSHSSQHLSVRDDGLNGSPRHLFMSAITQGIGSDGRHSSHSRLLPVNTGWVFKVVSDRTFSNSALTHPASHLAAVGLGSLFVFDVPLWMQIFSNNGWTAEAGASHMHAPSPSPRHCFGLLFYVIASPESGGGKNNTGENILLCLFRFYSHPSRKMSTITCWHIPQKHGLYVLHLSDKYPAYPWSLSTLVGNGRSGRKRLTCTCNNRAME